MSHTIATILPARHDPRIAHDVREVQVRRDRIGLYLWIQSTDGRVVLLTDTKMLQQLASCLSRAGLGHKQLKLKAAVETLRQEEVARAEPT